MNRERSAVRLAALSAAPVLLAAACPPALAQQAWTVTNLHPDGPTGSRCYSTQSGRQFGAVEYPNSQQGDSGVKSWAAVWADTPESYVDLRPVGCCDAGFWRHSVALSGILATQVGWVSQKASGTTKEASIWRDSAQSWISVHPANASNSMIVATNGAIHAGWIQESFPSSVSRAALWSDETLEPTILSPASWNGRPVTYAGVSCMSGNRQGGSAGLYYGSAVGHKESAVYWSGTPESMVNLHPYGIAPGLESSTISDLFGAEQVGWISFFNPSCCTNHAALWRGSAASFVDMNPPGAGSSIAYGVDSDFQVGTAQYMNGARAGFWRGTPESWTSLHDLLPSNFEWSEARGIDNDSETIRVVGFGFNADTGRVEALMWTRPAPCPGDWNDSGGEPNSSDFLAFLNDFANNDPRADIAPPGGDGLWDSSDFLAYLNVYAQGC